MNPNQDSRKPPMENVALSTVQPGLQQTQPNLPSYGVPPQITNAPSGVPPGLEYLAMVDQLFVSQKVHLFEALTGWDIANKYAIMNNQGQVAYYAGEDSDFCTRYICGPARPFEMIITDAFRREVLHISRPFRFGGCCCPCSLNEIEVSSNGKILGYVREEWSLGFTRFSVHNANNEIVLRIEGPWGACRCCNDVEFSVLSKDKSQKVGRICREWNGVVRQMLTDADNFGVNFPMDMDVNIKATLLAATFLIDFMYFENPNK